MEGVEANLRQCVHGYNYVNGDHTNENLMMMACKYHIAGNFCGIKNLFNSINGGS